jgi:hypothetical protein
VGLTVGEQQAEHRESDEEPVRDVAGISPRSPASFGGQITHYRALISIPITASSDADALTFANEHAARLRDDGGAVAGHVELVGELREDLMTIARVVNADAMFLRQLPLDWKP